MTVMHASTALRPLLSVAFTASLVLGGCASMEAQHRQHSADVAGALERPAAPAADAPTAASPVAPPPDVEAALLTEAPAAGGDAGATRFDVTVDQVPARRFFMGLVRDTPYNMVVHPDVDGTVSLELKGVTVDQVMQTVRRVYGYEYERTETGYLVLPQQLESRIFSVDYLNVDRKGGSETRVSSGQVTQGGGDSDDSGTDSDGNFRSSGGDRGKVSGSRVTTSTRSVFWHELEAATRALLGLCVNDGWRGDGGSAPSDCTTEDAGGRKVVVSPQSGLLVVRAMPGELREVADFLGQTQASIQRQVILEAKIVEVRLDEGFQSGINWGGLLSSDSGDRAAMIGQTGGGQLLSEGRSGISGATGDLNPAQFDPIDALASQAFGGMFSLSLATEDFTAFLELLETQGDVHVLSSPRVATVNNQKAVIKVGSDEFFVTDVSSTTVTGTTTTTTPDIELTPFFSGIALDVTPQIAADREVILHIHPTVSEVRDQTKEVTVGGQTQNLPLALSRVRESDSIVRARNGQVVVIGGLMETGSERSRAQTPALGDVPVLGELFRHRDDRSYKSELVILLRPLVVTEDGVWDDYVEESRRRVDGMRP